MKIKYLGHSCFKISGKSDQGDNVTIITDPFDPKFTGLSFTQQEADIVTISHHHRDHDYLEKIKAKNGDLFVAEDPGEYEVKNLRIYGINGWHDNKQGKERGRNTSYIYDFGEARIAHLGDIGHELTSDQIEQLENIEILMLPIGGTYTINPKEAIEVIEELEPLIVIPMHYKTDKHSKEFDELSTLKDFLSLTGSKVESTDELIIKDKSSLPTNLTIYDLSV